MRAARALGVPGSPIAILIWIPVVAVFLSVGLLMRIARRLELATPFVVIAALCLALSPLTQYLQGVGTIDHHFAEYIFVLASVGCGLGWFAAPTDTRLALILGMLLGAAPAIHNGLFVLQLPVLAGLLVFWLQDVRFPAKSMRVFCATLLLTTVAILVPSQPFRDGRFEFYYLSWFHLYVAIGTAVTALALTILARTRRNIAILAVIAVVLLLPLLQQIVVARSFLAGTIKRLDAISEVRSVPSLASTPWGRRDLTLMYSLLIWLLPFTAIHVRRQGLARAGNSGARVLLDLVPVRPGAAGHAVAAAVLRFVRPLPALAGAAQTKLRDAGPCGAISSCCWPRSHSCSRTGCRRAIELAAKTAVGGDPDLLSLRPILERSAEGVRAGPRHRAGGQRCRPLHPLLHAVLGDRQQLPVDAPTRGEDQADRSSDFAAGERAAQAWRPTCATCCVRPVDDRARRREARAT